ncbi:3-mercaptopyruvate sulfurtransferase [Parvularcula sp. IMCC14364]|uniref:3-mercaptopyruvate sulfurtransferase n=1 Tax=Parvularcula sp. IMCC14364 TaxID=3067902 RepID=UPI002741D53A|nr:3-mercaptopyruvate sulfurtransferase [Parvularcula sp. IMCC14364]
MRPCNLIEQDLPDRPDYLIESDALFAALGKPDLKIIDASWHLDPDRVAKTEYEAQHIPGAVFFDIDGIADQQSPLPHMLPSPDYFDAAARDLGLSGTDRVVVYDSTGIFSAPRVWWTLRIMGVQNVQILNGGLPAWIDHGYPLESGPVHIEPGDFSTFFEAGKVIGLTELKKIVADESAMILDARPADRFAGRAPEPRPGLKSGHISGSHNLPASCLIENGHMKTVEEIRSHLSQAGITANTDVIVSCGSGITAAILALGLALAGHERTCLYDGSWAEWGQLPDAFICR